MGMNITREHRGDEGKQILNPEELEGKTLVNTDETKEGERTREHRRSEGRHTLAHQENEGMLSVEIRVKRPRPMISLLERTSVGCHSPAQLLNRHYGRSRLDGSDWGRLDFKMSFYHWIYWLPPESSRWLYRDKLLPGLANAVRISAIRLRWV